MAVYSVYEPPKPPADLALRAEKLAFVKEGFSWPALLVPALWLIYQRMWIELVVFLAIFIVLPFAFGLDQQNEPLIGWISFAGTVMIAGGSFAMLAGLAGIINPDAFVVTTDNILKLSTRSWGWWHLIVGRRCSFRDSVCSRGTCSRERSA